MTPNRWQGNFAPITTEYDVPAAKLLGELPRELNGTLFRNGPNPQFPAPAAHWFSGDGMLHAFSLGEGRASYRNRWVRTPKWQAEHGAGRSLGSAFTANENGQDRGVANTHVVHHAGHLLALEEAHLPTRIEPHGLETLGYWNGGGALQGPFTAHPKLDPQTGELLFFGYGCDGPLSAGMSYGSIDASGRVTRMERFQAPYASMVHDFIVTQRHALFPILPLTASLARAQRGGPPYAWEPEQGASVGIMRRDGSTAEMRWFRGESCFVFHVMNAWDEGDRIVADVMRFDEPPLFPRPDGTPTDATRGARLWRWTFDLSERSERFGQQPLDDLAGEFPRIDERRTGLAYRHGWYACKAPGESTPGVYHGIAHVDHASGRTVTHWLPDGDAVSEPVFVPRSAEAPEGDGWLLATVYRSAEARSDLAVFNATALEDGAIATVQLSHRVPFGFHGSWVDAAALG